MAMALQSHKIKHLYYIPTFDVVVMVLMLPLIVSLQNFSVLATMVHGVDEWPPPLSALSPHNKVCRRGMWPCWA